MNTSKINPIVNYRDFIADKVSGPTVESKKSKPTADKEGVSYFLIPITYDYSLDEKYKSYDEFNIELAEMTSYDGLEVKNLYGRENGNIKTSFDLNNEDQYASYKSLDMLYVRGCEIFIVNKQQLKSQNTRQNITGIFSHPTYRKMDDDGNVVAGTKPAMYIDVSINGRYKTLFTDPSGKNIDCKLLEGNCITFIPLVTITSIFHGARTRYKFILKSAIVTSIKSVNSESLQTSTMSAINIKSPNISKILEEQIAKVSAMMTSTPYVPPTSAVESNEEEDESIGGASSSFVAVKSVPTYGAVTPVRSNQLL